MLLMYQQPPAVSLPGCLGQFHWKAAASVIRSGLFVYQSGTACWLEPSEAENLGTRGTGPLLIALIYPIHGSTFNFVFLLAKVLCNFPCCLQNERSKKQTKQIAKENFVRFARFGFRTKCWMVRVGDNEKNAILCKELGFGCEFAERCCIWLAIVSPILLWPGESIPLLVIKLHFSPALFGLHCQLLFEGHVRAAFQLYFSKLLKMQDISLRSPFQLLPSSVYLARHLAGQEYL